MVYILWAGFGILETFHCAFCEFAELVDRIQFYVMLLASVMDVAMPGL